MMSAYLYSESSEEDDVHLPTQHQVVKAEEREKEDNMDDLEASLFGNFSQNQREKHQRRVSEKKQRQSRPSETKFLSGSKPTSPDAAAPDNRSPLARRQSAMKPTTVKKSLFGIDDDILAELLSDSDDEGKKPKLSAAGKDTSTSDPTDQPADTLSSKGTNSVSDVTDLSSVTAVKPENHSLRSIKPVLSPLAEARHDKTKPNAGTLTKKKFTQAQKPRSAVARRSSDEDDDDLLACLGLGDESPIKKKSLPTKKKGKKDNKKEDEVAKPVSHTHVSSTSTASDQEKMVEVSQFGSYLPTVMSKPGLKLSKRGSDMPSLIFSSPSPSSSPIGSPPSSKKSVRFSQTMEFSDGVNRTKTPMAVTEDLENRKTMNVESNKQPELVSTASSVETSVFLATDADSSLNPPNMSNTLTGAHDVPIKQRRRRPISLTSSAANIFEDPPSPPEEQTNLSKTAVTLPESSVTPPPTTGSHSLSFLTTGSPSLVKRDELPDMAQQPGTNSTQPASSDQPTTASHSEAFVITNDLTDRNVIPQKSLPTLQSTTSPYSREKQRKNNHREQGDGAGVSQQVSAISQQGQSSHSLPSWSPQHVSHSRPTLVDDTRKAFEEENKQLKVQISELEGKITEMERELASAKNQNALLENQCRETEEALRREKQKLSEENEKQALLHRQANQELNNQIDELKLKLHKSELEKEQLSLSIEACKQRHAEELMAIETTNSAKLKNLEEDLHRKETRLVSEKDAEVSLCRQQIQQLEEEKVMALTVLKRQVATLEESRDSEIEKIKEMHRHSIKELQRQHELDMEQVRQRHNEELQDIKSVHSHTRRLAELTHQVESSVKEVSSLQGQFSNSLNNNLKERELVIKLKEDQLKTMDERLAMQRIENEKERERLQVLLAKFERHVSEKENDIEQERWKLQQDLGRLQAKQKAFEEDREVGLRSIEEHKQQLQRLKERLLADQQEGLAKTFSESRSVATERAEIATLENTLREKEREITKKAMRVEAELAATEVKVKLEKERVMRDSDQLASDQLQLKQEKEKVEHKMKTMELMKEEIERRTESLNKFSKTAEEVYSKGQESVLEAEKRQKEVDRQWKLLRKEAEQLRKKERSIATDWLAFLKEKRQHDEKAAASAVKAANSQLQQLSAGSNSSSTLSSPSPFLNPDPSLSHHHIISSTPHQQPHPHSHTGPDVVRHVQSQPTELHSQHHASACNMCGQQSTSASLTELQLKRCLRQFELDAEMDHKILCEEAKFLGYLEAARSHKGSLLRH